MAGGGALQRLQQEDTVAPEDHPRELEVRLTPIGLHPLFVAGADRARPY